MRRKMKRIWMTNEFRGKADEAIALWERENPKWRGKIIKDDPEPTARMSQDELLQQGVVGIYRNKP